MNYVVKLWNGELTPAQDCGSGDLEIAELVRLMEKNRGKLERGLDEGQRTLLEKYMDCAQEYEAAMNAQAFCEGFRLGSALLAEVFAGE